MEILTSLSYIIVISYFIYMTYRLQFRSLVLRNQEFKCIHCTECCKLRVKLSDKDIKRIETDIDYIDKDKGNRWIKKVNGYCIFLNITQGKSSCSIYDMRPEVCRSYPRIRPFGIKSFDPRCKALKLPRIFRFL